MAKRVEFYFDYVSPYAYLMFRRLHELPKSFEVTYRPVLLAGLLQHWGTKGPAEVPPRQAFTYRQVEWLARQQGTSFRMCDPHPFNPLALLRLTLAQQCARGVIDECFRYVWQQGKTPLNEADFSQLLSAVAERSHTIPTALQDGMQCESVKTLLRSETDKAAAKGVFGVPTLRVADQLYFGLDSLAMFLEDHA